jgi:hypothetical protein
MTNQVVAAIPPKIGTSLTTGFGHRRFLRPTLLYGHTNTVTGKNKTPSISSINACLVSLVVQYHCRRVCRTSDSPDRLPLMRKGSSCSIWVSAVALARVQAAAPERVLRRCKQLRHVVRCLHSNTFERRVALSASASYSLPVRLSNLISRSRSSLIVPHWPAKHPRAWLRAFPLREDCSLRLPIRYRSVPNVSVNCVWPGSHSAPCDLSALLKRSRS